MKKKLNRTHVMGVLCILFSIWVFWQASQIPMKLVSNEPGPRLFPYIAAAGILICSVLSLIFDAPKQEERDSKKKQTYDARYWKRILILTAVCILFGIGMYYIGFWITGMIGVFAFTMLLKDQKKINIVAAVVFSAVLASVCYFGFTRGFNIPLPKGELWSALGIKML
ncbi:MAG: tripartite tricarboxylate transporter TctB family protein [Lachnospiraceae bacterium]|nr:tripartite tricarboxylate transporter TctB family protein [Lachnospiraceae bacterium]